MRKKHLSEGEGMEGTLLIEALDIFKKEKKKKQVGLQTEVRCLLIAIC
jgi:hypothetical protein